MEEEKRDEGGHLWTSGEDFILIELWRKHSEALINIDQDKTIYQQFANKMKGLGVEGVEGSDIESRIQYLWSRYM